ncbi:hypothetical protein [Marixanthomonas spongiae]|uniref:Uncharacterized protein n=1 Tax=Marixanthomonas spongiae TaxID=2174845 RepID=A0A2U0I7M2_9FLAO|nr:hypothetical protein [Marixanthomonas spongiae]PVW17091.1 hypothetical protein DDV96_00790 [Marixanthomonas spongiae]
MEPNKFEETIREKLQEREIQPSSDAWRKLDARLGKPEKKNGNFMWYAIAASLVSILVIGALLFTKSKEVSEIENLVETPTNIELRDYKKQPALIPQKASLEDVAVEENTTTDKTENLQIVEERLAAKKTKLNQSAETSFEKQKAVAKTETNGEAQSIPKHKTEGTTNDLFIEKKINEVVAQVKEMQTKNNTVTAREVDVLLAKAQRDIKTRQLLNPHTQKVDASALLLDVELELERSFREKVFDALGEGFNKIRTAVVKRND